MKKLKIILILSVIAILTFSCQTGSRGSAEGSQITIVLTNPTVGNLETVKYLIEKEIFSVTGQINYLCI